MGIRRHICFCVLTLLPTLGSLVESTVAQDLNREKRLPPGAVGRFGSLLYRTQGWCSASALSPDGKILAVAGMNIISLTDLDAGQRIGELKDNDSLLLSFLDQGKTLVSVGADGMVRYWSVAKKIESRPSWQAFKSDDSQDLADVSPNGQFLLVPGEESLNVWDLNQQRRLHQCKTPTQYGPFALAPDGNSIATFDAGNVVVLDSATGRQKAISDEGWAYPNGIRFSPDGKLLATKFGYEKYRLWDAETLREKHVFEQLPAYHYHMAFSPDSKWLALPHGDNFLRVWDLASKKEISKASLLGEGYSMSLSSLHFSPDQRRLISTEHAAIRIWAVATGQQLTADGQPQHRASSLSASPNGKTLAGIYGRTLRVWDVATFKERFHRDDIDSRVHAEFSKTTDKIVYAHAFHTARVVNVLTGEELARLEGHIREITAATFAADDRKIYTASQDGTLRVWDAATGKELRKHVLEFPKSFEKDKHDHYRYDTFSADGQMLMTRFRWDNNDQLWRFSTETGKRLESDHPLGAFSEIYLAPDGRTFVGAGPGDSFDVVESATGESIISLHAARQRNRETPVWPSRSAAYSPDSRLLAVRNEVRDRTDIWDIQASKIVQKIYHDRSTVGMVFVGNNLLATGSPDTTVLLWNVSDLRKKP